MAVIRIGETEWHDMKRQYTWPRGGGCEHKRLRYSDHGDVIDCLDCDKQVSAIWALRMFFTNREEADERLRVGRAELESKLQQSVIHRGALLVQDAWRRLKYCPTCPHCHKPISAPDGFGSSYTRDKAAALPLEMPANLQIVPDKELGHA